VQLVGIADLKIGVLVLDTREKPAAGAEQQGARDARAGAVGADQIPRGAMLAQVEAALQACRVLEGRSERDLRARGLGLASKPAHHPRRVRGKKVVAGRGEVDVSEVRSVEAHAGNAPHQRGGQGIEQRNLIDRVLHNDARGVQLFADILFLLKHRDIKSAARQRVRARQTREARAYHNAVALRRCHRPTFPGKVNRRKRA